MIENEVRRMLDRRADDVTPSPDAWSEIERRMNEYEAEVPAARLERRPSHHLPPLLVAAGVVVALGVAALVVTRPDGTARVNTTPAGPSSTTTVTAPAPAPTGRGPAALWPATTPAGLAAMQAEADAGRRPDLLDPRAAAGQYLSELINAPPGPRADFEPGEFRAGDAQSGEVPYLSNGLPGNVLVRRLGGEGSIWYVVALTHLTLPVMNVGYDGTRFTAEVQPTQAGRLRVDVSDAAGVSLAGFDYRVTAGQLVKIDEPVAGDAVAIARFLLIGPGGTLNMAAVRADGPSPVRPAYCEVLDSVRGERPESYVGSAERLADIDRLTAAAPPEIAGDLASYRNFVADSVDPADPPSRDVENWPAAVRAAVRRIEIHDSRLCRGAP